MENWYFEFSKISLRNNLPRFYKQNWNWWLFSLNLANYFSFLDADRACGGWQIKEEKVKSKGETQAVEIHQTCHVWWGGKCMYDLNGFPAYSALKKKKHTYIYIYIYI